MCRFVTLLELFSPDLSFTKPKLIDLGSIQFFVIITIFMCIYRINQNFVNKYLVFNLVRRNLFLNHADILFFVVSFMFFFVVFLVFKIVIMFFFVVFLVFKIVIITKNGPRKKYLMKMFLKNWQRVACTYVVYNSCNPCF